MNHHFMEACALALCLLPAAAGATGGAVDALPNDGNGDVHYTTVYSSAFSTDGMNHESQSSLYFNDGFGRLTEFEMKSENHVMTLTIRQNMGIVWKGSCHVDNDAFSVVRRESMGHIYFLITMGEHHYRGEITGDDKWEISEDKGELGDLPISGASGIGAAGVHSAAGKNEKT